MVPATANAPAAKPVPWHLREILSSHPYSADETRRWLRLGEVAFRNLLKDGKLPFRPSGRHKLILGEAIVAYLRQQSADASSASEAERSTTSPQLTGTAGEGES